MLESIGEFIDYFSKIIYSKPFYFGTLQLIEILILIRLLYWDNLFNLSIAYPIYTQLFVLFIIFFYILLFFFLSIKAGHAANEAINVPSELNVFIQAVAIIAFLAFIIFIIFSFAHLIKHYFSLFTGKVFHYLFFTLFLICAMSITYVIFSKQFARLFSTPFFALLFEVMMFLPCLLVRFIEYIKFQCKITTKPIWLLLGLEILIISLWILIPKTIQLISKHSEGVQLLTEPIYLRDPVTLGSFENLHLSSSSSEDSSKPDFKYHYSLSAWFYINPQPPATSSAYTKYTNILNYGGKPTLQYNGQLNSLRVMAETKDGETMVEIFETKDIIYQKWNNIVINYDGGSMDIFLNGELVGAKPNIVPYMTYENVEVGATNGIQGGICNITYYDSIIPKSKIVTTYRLLRNKKVPTYF